MQELKELQRQGMSIQAISKLTGWDRKTIRKYVQAAGVAPEYGPRLAQPSNLDAFKPYLEERLPAGVWNAWVLLRELRERNYAGLPLQGERGRTALIGLGFARFDLGSQIEWDEISTTSYRQRILLSE